MDQTGEGRLGREHIEAVSGVGRRKLVVRRVERVRHLEWPGLEIRVL